MLLSVINIFIYDMDLSIKFIGEIHSDLKKIEDCPLQENENAPQAVVIVFPEFTEGIKDIIAGSEIL
jgi:tRNA (Thr-GGU) A37 N-methylase